MKGTHTLREAFEQRRKSLENRLLQLSDTQEIVRSLDSELNALQDACVGSLHMQEAKLLMRCLDVLRAALRSVSAISGRDTESAPAPAPAVSKTPLGQILLTVAQLILLIVLAAAPLGTPWLVRTAIFFVAFLVLIEFGFQLIGQTAALRGGASGRLLGAFGVSLTQTPTPAIRSSLTPPGISVDAPKLCEKLASALGEIDGIVASAAEEANKPKLEANSFARERPLLEFLQELFAASLAGDSVFALKKARSIPGLLLHHGLKAVSHQDVEIAKRAEFFETFPNTDPAATQLVTERPAIVVGDRVELRGRVLEPIRAVEPRT